MQSALREKKIAVLGFGLEGKAIIDYFFRHGIKPVLFDQSPKSTFSKSDQKFISRHCSKSYFGKKAFTNLAGFDIAFKSPGIPPASLKDLPKKLQLTSQTEEFIKAYGAQTIGVTGTKGKGTTSTLIYQMLKADGRTGYLTGNIGEVQAFDISDKLKPQDFVVFELSSFQLRNLTVSPHVAVVLMTTSEHLNWHSTLKDYLESKSNITKHQKPGDLAIVNSDYPGSRHIGKQGKGKKFFASRKRPLKNGCFVKDGLVLRASKGLLTKIVKTADIGLKGEHNWENVCAAAETALLLGCKLSVVRKILKTFRGLPHRLEYAGSKHGVNFYNDSFSTIPETTIAAFQAFKEPVVLILGGAGKRSDFTQMAKIISKSPHLRAVVVMGKEKRRILDALFKAKMQKSKIHAILGGFNQAFLQATRLAKKGDTLLLSPACASFDMFKNYKQRGEVFKALVKKLHE